MSSENIKSPRPNLVNTVLNDDILILNSISRKVNYVFAEPMNLLYFGISYANGSIKRSNIHDGAKQQKTMSVFSFS